MGFVTNTQLKQVEQTLVENIKNGIMKVGHSEVADNLTPYSADSGTAQENPFISQGTGTNNNTEIVTVGDYGLLKSKNGNTIVVNQLARGNGLTSYGLTSSVNQDGSVDISGTYDGTSEYNLFTFTLNIVLQVGHTYLVFKNKNINQKWCLAGFRRYAGDVNFFTLTYERVFTAYVALGDLVENDVVNITELKVYCIDLTQMFNGDIPQDLLDHPENFFRYYQGSLAYNTGEIKNAIGRYLKTTGRNVWDEEWEVINNKLSSKNYIKVVPNTNYFINQYNLLQTIILYDNEFNQIGSPAYTQIDGGCKFNTSNATYIKFTMLSSYSTTYNHDITISLYYSPEQGGEGYDQYYPYEAPHVVDTGSEVLRSAVSVRDVKTPDGTITRKIVDIDLSTLKFQRGAYGSGIPGWYVDVPTLKTGVYGEVPNIIADNYYPQKSGSVYNSENSGGMTIDFGATARLWIFTSSSANPSGHLYAELKEYTTEQGTSFAENLPINDYGMMYWDDDVPQGASIFYPINYKGFLDDLYSRVSGDSSEYALESDISDTALAERGYYKMQDLSSGITDVAGLTYLIKRCYKERNIVTLAIRATNETDSTISENTILFSMPIGALDSNNAFLMPINIRRSGSTITTVGWIYTNGDVVISNELQVGDTAYINFTYAVT